MKDHAYGEHRWPVSVPRSVYFPFAVERMLRYFHQASQDDQWLATELFERLPELLESGKVKPNSVLPLKGLDSVPEGFEMYRQGKILAQKIVYELL